MTSKSPSRNAVADPAAIFACALSLWQECQKRAKADDTLNLSNCFNGMDQFMREMMRIGTAFDTWACDHLDFNEFKDVWPYLLEDKFGPNCLNLLSIEALADFNEEDCLRIALRLRLPVIIDGKLPIPLDLTLLNPIKGSGFREFRIQTVRDCLEDGHVVPFVAGDEPFDEEFAAPYFGIYGVDGSGELEHVADRGTYADAIALLKNLAPGISLNESPVFS
jgi:hypothetical protein